MEMHAKALFEMKQISDLQISKDGNFAVFVVAETSLKEDKKFTNIWVKDLNCPGEPSLLPRWHQHYLHLPKRRKSKISLL